MSDLLKVHVERAVRPLRADVWRKLRIREELYSALRETYHEERQRAASDDEAMSAAIARFGSADGLTRELQQSVPRLEAGTSGFTQALRQRAHESVCQHALRVGGIYLALMVALLLAVWGVVLPVRGWDAARDVTGLLLLPITALGAVLCVIAVEIASCGLRCAPARRWAWLAVVIPGLALSVYVLTAGALLVFSISADSSAAQDTVWIMSPLAAAALVLHCVFVALLNWERRRAAEWELIDLGPEN